MLRPPAHLPRLAAWLLAGISFAASAALPTVPTPAAEPARSFAAAGLLQAGFGLALVLALIFGCAWLARRFGLLQQPGSGRLVKVVSSAMVGQRERVVVVEVGSTWLVLGVAAGQVRALHSMPAEALPEAPGGAAMNATNLRSGRFGAGAFSHKLLESIDKLSTLNKLKKRD
ncbi:MAG: flagellar biosynthetic protein FliO [Polaromonas sp. 39-63-203]|uniref:flagellar biosynthetic protein FliO n=1 Tax=Polaromonas sp. TaxID=1869339 RepID=UPI000BDA2C37|nr:flagellar biosynthetic protein FliO [Polaromonas sp.]OYY53930.1 MAG: flagellar biosynthetic protein FliO [Polaromonas sp. 35-63-240]OYZ02456.1 MAG: flagellar biosynthetic protein FliO [Polaromonas sp. 28-63-22]OYZ84920.1 MAG: flagellar biosynthetic protein FliO [Polaromonas sp. 24-62-144]OZA99004.1 MAG: flagellar biosynthetic protein FliO [Polaromonas sp. 39-63-203]HQS31583.1 flagellar biosynthetic protein FliO [Polaromonas sp.]